MYLEDAIEDMHKNRKVILHYGDMTDSESMIRIIREVEPDEIYNLAAQSHVQVSFEVPEFTADCDATGVLRILEAVHFLGMEKKCRIYQASTSELFGLVQEVPQKETTPFYPRSPYAVAKMYGFWIMKNYRESYGMFCANGILFNHESERRGETFVTRKITLAASCIAQGMQKKLYLGNLNALRDWGYAKDYVECMWLILQQDKPDDFVVATGEQHSVREFCQYAFREVGIEVEFKGEGVNAKGYNKATGEVIIEVDPKYFRPAEVETLLGDHTESVVKTFLNQGFDFQYIKNAENLGMDGNFVHCFKRAKGKYVWVLGDDDFLLPGSLARIVQVLSSEQEYGLMHVSLDKTELNDFITYDKANLFISDISYWITFISANIVNTKYVKEIDFDKYMGTFFTLIPLYFTAAYKEEKNIFCSFEVLEAGKNIGTNGSYNYFEVFTKNYLTIWKEYKKNIGITFIQYEKEKHNLFKKHITLFTIDILIRKKFPKMKSDGAWNYLFKYYWYEPYFYVFLLKYPLYKIKYSK